MHNLGCTLYIVVRFLWFFHYISLFSETLFFILLILDKDFVCHWCWLFSIIFDNLDVFDWSLVRFWIQLFSNEPETAKMESPFEYKPKTSSQTCTLARRSYSQISSLVGWLGCGRYSLLVFRFWNVTSTNHVSFLMFSVYNRSCSLHCDNVLQTMLFTFINITYRFKYIR